MLLKVLVLGLFGISFSNACIEECLCHGFKFLSQEVKDDLCTLPKYYEKCQITCDKCTPTTTTEPKTTLKTTSPTTTSTTTSTTTPTTTRTTTPTTKPTTTPTTTRTTTPVKPINGACGDYDVSCRTLADSADKSDLCDSGYSSVCPATCGSCVAKDNEKCQNFQDNAYQCSQRNCLDDSNLIEQFRVHLHCSKTCCQRDEFYVSDILKQDPFQQFEEKFHPKLLRSDSSMFRY